MRNNAGVVFGLLFLKLYIICFIYTYNISYICMYTQVNILEVYNEDIRDLLVEPGTSSEKYVYLHTFYLYFHLSCVCDIDPHALLPSIIFVIHLDNGYSSMNNHYCFVFSLYFHCISLYLLGWKCDKVSVAIMYQA